MEGLIKRIVKMKLSMVYAAIGCWSILAIGCGRSEESAAVPRNVKVVGLSSNGLLPTHEFNGVLEEAKKVDLSFRVSGPVISVLAEEGDVVKKGELLAAIDPRDYEVQQRSAEALFKQAKGEYDRFKELYDQGKLPPNTIEKLEAALLASKSNFERASNALDDTHLIAPFSGMVFQRNIQKHETAVPGTIVFTIIDMSELEVVFGVPESIVAQIVVQTDATVQAGGLDIPATIKSVAGKSGSDNLFEVRLSINNPDAKVIRPGMNARIVMEMDKMQQAGISVPVEAVFYQKGESFVWVYEHSTGTVASRSIKVGKILSGGRMEILSGLDGHEKVVSAGVHSLFEKQEVRAIETTSMSL